MSSLSLLVSGVWLFLYSVFTTHLPMRFTKIKSPYPPWMGIQSMFQWNKPPLPAVHTVLPKHKGPIYYVTNKPIWEKGRQMGTKRYGKRGSKVIKRHRVKELQKIDIKWEPVIVCLNLGWRRQRASEMWRETVKTEDLMSSRTKWDSMTVDYIHSLIPWLSITPHLTNKKNKGILCHQLQGY